MRRILIAAILVAFGFSSGFLTGVFYYNYRTNHPINQIGLGSVTDIETESIPAIVDRVIDGDTLEVTTQGLGSQTLIVRLFGVDAPEVGEQGEEEATKFVANLVLGKQVTLETQNTKTDMFGRTLAWVWVLPDGEKEELNLSVELLDNNLAELYLYPGQALKYRVELETSGNLDNKQELKK